mmetsp:Transcript_38598/g.73962  ORF Transcript_38598/g.73962 Transcript_38598/m.73962 type:complete len:607 (-) Transcript_38598:297-2117(-)
MLQHDGDVEHGVTAHGLFSKVEQVALVHARRLADELGVRLGALEDDVHEMREGDLRALHRRARRHGSLLGPLVLLRHHALQPRERQAQVLALRGNAPVLQQHLGKAAQLVPGHGCQVGLLGAQPHELLQRAVQQHHVPPAVPVAPVVLQLLPALERLARHPPLLAVVHHLPQVPLQAVVQVALRHDHHGLEVRAGMHSFEDPEVVLEVVDDVGHVSWVSFDAVRPPPTLHVRHALPGDASVLPEVAPELSRIAAAALEVDVRLANRNVLYGGVGVQLLMPRLQEVVLDPGAMALADAVAAQDVEDLQADLLRVPASARHARHGEPCKVAHHRVRVGARNRPEHLRQRLLHVAHVLGLVVAIAVPVEQLHVGEPQPGVDEAHGVASRDLLRLPEQLHGKLVARHQRVRRPVTLRVQRLVKDVRSGGSLDVDVEAVAVVVPLLLRIHNLQDKYKTARSAFLGYADAHGVVVERGLHRLVVLLVGALGPDARAGQVPVVHSPVHQRARGHARHGNLHQVRLLLLVHHCCHVPGALHRKLLHPQLTPQLRPIVNIHRGGCRCVAYQPCADNSMGKEAASTRQQATERSSGTTRMKSGALSTGEHRQRCQG